MATQKSSNDFWIDESGNKIPYSRTTRLERSMEHKSAKLLKDAKDLSDRMAAFKDDIARVCAEIYAAFMAEKEVKPTTKGNFTWYNFDRSIKIEVAINERITFDELQISAAREKLDQFLTENMDGKVEFIKELVIDAFKTSRGQLDAKKIMSLLKYRSKIRQPLFQSAMEDIEAAIRRPASKTYYRVFERTDEGNYKLVDLNFSTI